MLRLIHSSPYAVVVIGNNTGSNYYSNILDHEPITLTQFLTYSSVNQHVNLVWNTPRMKDYLQKYPDSSRSYEGMSNEPIKAIKMNNLDIAYLIEKYKSQSHSNGLNTEIVRHSTVPLFYEANFTIKDVVRLRKAALKTDNPIRLEFLNTVGVESLVKDAVRRMTFK